jgi:hypothetical protein
MVPGYRNRPQFGVLGFVAAFWCVVSGILLLGTVWATIEDGVAETPVEIWIAAATFPLAVAGVVVGVQRYRRDRRLHPKGDPSVGGTERELLLLDAAGLPESRVPGVALGAARLFWDRYQKVGPALLGLDAGAPGHKGSFAVGPYRRQPHRHLLNWLSWELDPAAVHRHRDELLGAVPDELVLVVDRFHCDPRLVVRLIEHYRDHPDQRSELATGDWRTRATRLAQTVDVVE